MLGAVIDGEDHDAVILDGIGGNEGGILNNHLAGTRYSTRSPGHWESRELLNAGDDMHCDPSSDFLTVGQRDIVMSLAKLPGRLLGPLDHGRARPVFFSRFTTSA